jgi:hypothetical protein
MTGYQTNFLRNDFISRKRIHKLESSAVLVLKPGWVDCRVTTRAHQRFELPLIAAPLPYLDLELNLNQALSAIALITSKRP